MWAQFLVLTDQNALFLHTAPFFLLLFSYQLLFSFFYARARPVRCAHFSISINRTPNQNRERSMWWVFVLHTKCNWEKLCVMCPLDMSTSVEENIDKPISVYWCVPIGRMGCGVAVERCIYNGIVGAVSLSMCFSDVCVYTTKYINENFSKWYEFCKVALSVLLLAYIICIQYTCDIEYTLYIHIYIYSWYINIQSHIHICMYMHINASIRTIVIWYVRSDRQ